MARLLKLKSNVRQRRVMADLLCVNVMAIAFDIILVTLIYSNHVGIRFPFQNFSYILKLRLEFAVLNQLMDLAARGMRRGNLGENRYYRTGTPKITSSHDNNPPPGGKDLSKDPAQTTLTSSMPLSDFISPLKSTYQVGPTNRSGSDIQVSGQESEPQANHTCTAVHSHRGNPDDNEYDEKEKPLWIYRGSGRKLKCDLSFCSFHTPCITPKGLWEEYTL